MSVPAPIGWKHQLPITQTPTCITENNGSPVHHPTTMDFLVATRRKIQLPVFKHPLENLRATILPSTTLPPWFLKFFLNNTLQQYRHIKAYHFFSVMKFFSSSIYSCLTPLDVSFHLLFLCSSHALRFSDILLISPFLLRPAYVLHIYIFHVLFLLSP
jgi:hypothetical protein